MSIKTIGGLCLGFLGISMAGIAAAEVSEYTTFATWAPTVNGVNTYVIGGLPPGVLDTATGPVTFGAGTFAGDSHDGYIFNDGAYGTGVEYFADSPQIDSHLATAAVTVSFKASAGITALAFALGTLDHSSDVDISVNGSALSPVFVPGGSPTNVFFGVSDTSGSIKSIQFTSAGTGEMDVIGSYSTAKTVGKAPEFDSNSWGSALALLFGSIAVLRGRDRKVTLAPRRLALK